MGLSASQARLLSITARISSNELESQQISNSKLRLADKTQEASEEYIEALSATKLTYCLYDSSGSATSVNLTPAVIYEYGDLKNQYGLVNSQGQILVSSTDAKNFEASENISQFLECYDCKLTDNPEYLTALESIYGSNYANYFNADTRTSLVDTSGVSDWLNGFTNESLTSEDAYNAWAAKLPIVSSSSDSGSYGDFVTLLNDIPAYPGDEPVYDVNLWDYAQALLSPQCWSSTNITALLDGTATASDENVWHMEHVLSQYLWTKDSSAENYYDGGTLTAYEYDDDGNVTGSYTITNTGSTYAMSSGGGNGDDPMDVRSILDLEEYAELKQKLIDLYYQIAKNIYENNTNNGLTSGSIEVSNGSAMSAEEIGELYKELIYELLMAVAEVNIDDLTEYQEAIAEYEAEHAEWEEAWAEITEWANSSLTACQEYLADLDALPKSFIYDDDDTKSQWYINLWHRMNGSSKVKSNDANKNYKQLEDNLLSSEAWLKFALTNGIITFEKVQYVSEAESETGLSTTEWKSVSYSTCSDITEVEDETAIAKAEVVYNNKLAEIETKDTKYDNDLKKLDTEHSALQTEYDSVKTVIDKNVERSFQAFS